MRHPGTIALLVAAALAAGASGVGAEEEEETRWYPTLQLGVNGTLNLGDLAALNVVGGGAHVEAELRVSPIVLFSIDYEWLGGTASNLDEDVSLGLTQQRYGAKVRHPILGFGSEKIHGDYFVLAGFGRERTAWNAGGVLHRNYVLTGFGCSVTFSRPSKGEDKKWMIGSFGLRAMVSRAPDPGKVPAGCDGPCDSLTKTAPYDTTLLLEVGMRFGS